MKSMGKKGTAFTGLAGGAHYKRWSKLFGMNEKFYRQGLGGLALGQGMQALDLGCGPGALSFALAETAHPDAAILGLDISDDQLAYARSQAHGFPCALEFRNASMDEIPYPDETFDLVMSSMALHETPPAVRRAAIRETARVLKTNGVFLLVEWSRPKLGLWGAIWLPLIVWGEKNKDNWNNAYPALCRDQGLFLEEDRYINSLARRQLFRKGSPAKADMGGPVA